LKVWGKKNLGGGKKGYKDCRGRRGDFPFIALSIIGPEWRRTMEGMGGKRGSFFKGHPIWEASAQYYGPGE